MTNPGGVIPLRMLRERRGWTQQDVADQLARLAWLRCHERVGANADMVAKWERGVKLPSRRYRELLALLFGLDAAELASNNRMTPAEDQQGGREEENLLTALLGAAELLDRLGPNGTVLQAKMFAVWKDEILRRRVLLKLVGLAPMTGLAFPDLQLRTLKPTPALVLGLDELVGKYQVLYHSTAPSALMTPVVAHLETIRELLRESLTPGIRRRLFANRARVAMLAGRLAFFDMQDPMAARGYFSLGLEAAREVDDQLQAAAALGHTAFIPAADHAYEAALDYLKSASRHVDKRPHGPMSSWLAAIESEIQTNAGSKSAALAAIDRSRSALSASAPAPSLAWFDYFDDTRLAGFAGYVELRSGRFEQARATLASALDRLPEEAVKQRAVFLCDLATVHLKSGDLDQACGVAGEAADQLHRAGYATGSGRLREFRTAVHPWVRAPAVRTLDEHLSGVA